ncbi:MAG: DUF1513 domain-containing protein [Hyphomicrobiaceae bacterium]
MVIDRRSWLTGLAGLVATSATRAAAVAGPREAPRYAAARSGRDGRYSAAILDSAGRGINSVVLPGRGHDATFCPRTRRCVVFARRPGNFAVAFSVDRNEAPIAFTTPTDRHFYGHGVFSGDGRLLYATENDFDAARGVIGVYDATAAFRRLGEFPSYGIGPHDMALMQGGAVLVVANGGLREHPDIGGGRRVLNPDAVETSLVYIDPRSGDLVERHDLPGTSQLSLRHLDVGAGDTIVLGAQAQGGGGRAMPMLFRHRRQGRLETIALPDTLNAGLVGYVSSVAVSRDGRSACVTSSKGGVALILEVATGRVRATRRVRDVSGVAAAGGRAADAFVLTTGEGDILGMGEAQRHQSTAWRWDNHLAAG